MIYAVQLYTVGAGHVPEFLAAFQPQGLWTDIARFQPGYIHTDLLRNPSDPSRFLSIDFWTSIRALGAGRRSPEVRRFAGWLSRQSIDCEGLGMFVFPPLPLNLITDEIFASATLADGDTPRKLHRSGMEVRP